MRRESESTQKSDNPGKSLKKYSAPVLVEYGDIRELTKTVGMGVINDGQMDKSS